jgi:integrase
VGEYFEIDEAARFLETARQLDLYHELIATFLLTGGRRNEVFGLLVDDVDFEANRVRIEPNRFRRLKRPWSERTVPLWPQLREILLPYVERRQEGQDLLFQSDVPRSNGMITDLRSPLRKVAKRAGLPVPTVNKFRHTYATARLQTTDNGKPVAPWTVKDELGHKDLKRVEDTYGHLGLHRHRAEVVEYRLAVPGEA